MQFTLHFLRICMALKATIYKASMNIADMTRHVYLEQNITFAQHPSETDKRMMLRLLAWALFADENLKFTKGLCEETEPELWIKEYNEDITLWIELGLPDEKRLKKACNQAKNVVLFTYDDNAAEVWKSKNLNKLHPYSNMQIIHINDEILEALADARARTMSIQASIEDDQMWFTVNDTVISVFPEYWKK